MFFFPFGCVVFWGVARETEREILRKIKKFSENPSQNIEFDDFLYSFGDKARIHGDEYVLEDDSPLSKLAISHAIAQSTKLSFFEGEIAQLIKKTKYLPEELARTGKIPLDHIQMGRLMGELFVEKHNVNLHSDILDTPEFFWDHPELEAKYYSPAIASLDLKQRVAVLNKKLEVVQELFEMLRDELKTHQTHKLEVTIIWLILADIFLEAVSIVLEYIVGNCKM